MPPFITISYCGVFEAQELEDLLEHIRSYRTLDSKRLWHLRGRLLRIDLNRFRTISKLVKLTKNLLSLTFEFLLEYFQGLLVIKLFPLHYSFFITKKCIDLAKQILSWSSAMFEMLVDTLFTEVAQYQHVILLQLLSNDPRQNRLIVRNEVILILFLTHLFLLGLLFEFVGCVRL